MADWHTYLNTQGSVSTSVCAELLQKLVGVAPTSETGPREGNPIDFWSYRVTLTSSRPDLELSIVLREFDNPAPTTSVNEAALRAPATTPFSTAYAAWTALLDGLASLGCTTSGARKLGPIIIDAEAAGAYAVAKELRAKATATAIADARGSTSVSHWTERFDTLETVLAAYDPEIVTSISLYDCEMVGIPAGVARFQNATQLTVYDMSVDAASVRALSLPKLTFLSVCDCAIRELRGEDLAGVPQLSELYVCRAPLADLDPGIIEVCPRLQRVVIADTPLASNAAKLGALRERWASVVWEAPPSTW